jgi:hypothetical protein
MMVEKPSKLQPAIAGGLVGGLLTAIPGINFVNACCCLWIVLGGMIAARMLIKRSPVLPITSGEGATVGALAGLVGAMIYMVIGVPLGLLVQPIMFDFIRQFGESSGDPVARETIRKMVEEFQNQSVGQKLIGAIVYGIFYAVIIIAFSCVGGIIGVAFFEKRKMQPPPMGGPGYPPDYYPGSTPPAPPPGPPAPPPNEPPYGGGQPPPY